MAKGDLAHLDRPGVILTVRVTARASKDALSMTEAGLAVRVTEPPENGKANAAVARLLARALGIPKSRLRLVSGQGARNKVFRVD